MRTAVAGFALAALLGVAGCGGGGEATEPTPPAAEDTTDTAETATPTARASTPPRTAPPTSATSTPTRPADDVPVELQAAVVANTAGDIFADAREPLLEAIKADSEVEAVEVFDFDRETSTPSLDMASVYDSSEEAMTGVAYKIATGLAPLMWAPEIASQVTDTAALPTLNIEVNGLSFECDGGAMAALADTALSEESFIDRCRG